ncbi:MAG: replication-relaxation family protein [Chloroflexota bacterium]|nr:replication-relaxation family protein [Chloroflexota bacterium]
MKLSLRPATPTRLGPSGRVALQLLARCSRMPTDVVGDMMRMRHARSAAQLLLRLRAAGLADYETSRPGPLVGSRTVRLWSLTPAGRALLPAPGLASAEHGLLPYGSAARSLGMARRRSLPMLTIVYRLLAHIVRDLDQPVCVAAWEHPWIRTLGRAETGRAHHVRLPAAATLLQDTVVGEQPRGLLLLPDLGTLPVASYRPVLRRLIELRRARDVPQPDEPLLIVGVAAGPSTTARVLAWHALLQQVTRRAGEQPLHARVLAWPEGVVACGTQRSRFGSRADHALGLVARHPLLTRRQLAALLGVSETRAGQHVRRLESSGWIRTILVSGDSPPDVLGRPAHLAGPLPLVELTPAGRREASRRLLLPASAAARYHGLLGSGASTRRFSHHLAHTLGANAVFVAFVVAARRMTGRGGDDTLEEWRSAAACGRGRFRPDGYGCYRRAGSRFGFFLEFDRGTEKPREYAAKLAAYYRYRDSSQSKRDYDGFPVLLVVTTSDVAEARFAYEAYLAQQRRAATPLLVFLTTVRRIQAHADGVLGPVWGNPGPHPYPTGRMRGCWLPALRCRGMRPKHQVKTRLSSWQEVDCLQEAARGLRG